MKKTKKIIMIMALMLIGCGDAYLIAREMTPNTPSESEITIKRRCRTCNGTGKVDERIPCSNCDGYGCGVCDWEGYKIIKVDCPECDNGWIYVN